MARGDTIVGLDVGSTKVAVIIGSMSPDGQMQIIGFGSVPSAGIRRGSIIDIENTVRSIEGAIERAEQMSGRAIDGGYVGITGISIASINNRGVVAVADPEQEIAREDVERVLQAARVISLPHDRRVVHVIPRQFIVDGNENILDPVGMSGSRLEVETQIVTIANAAVQNLLKCCERAGFRVQELVLSSLASGEAVLLPAEKELGVMVVDIGGGATDIAVYDQGSLWYSAVLPVGGDYITSDLAVGLRTPLNLAEDLKKRAGSVLPVQMSDNEMVDVPRCGRPGGASGLQENDCQHNSAPGAGNIWIGEESIREVAVPGPAPGRGRAHRGDSPDRGHNGTGRRGDAASGAVGLSGGGRRPGRCDPQPGFCHRYWAAVVCRQASCHRGGKV